MNKSSSDDKLKRTSQVQTKDLGAQSKGLNVKRQTLNHRRQKTSTPHTHSKKIVSLTPEIDKFSFIKSLQLINSDGSTDEEKTDSGNSEKKDFDDDQSLFTDSNLSIEEYYWKGPFQNTSVHDMECISNKSFATKPSRKHKEVISIKSCPSKKSQKKTKENSEVHVEMDESPLRRSQRTTKEISEGEIVDSPLKRSQKKNSKNVFDIMKFAACKQNQSNEKTKGRKKQCEKLNTQQTLGSAEKSEQESGHVPRKRRRINLKDSDDPKSDFTDTASDIEVVTVSKDSVTFSKPKRRKKISKPCKDEDEHRTKCTPYMTSKPCGGKNKHKTKCTPPKKGFDSSDSYSTSSEKRRKTLYSFKEKFSEEIDSNHSVDDITETWMEIGDHLASIAQSLKGDGEKSGQISDKKDNENKAKTIKKNNNQLSLSSSDRSNQKSNNEIQRLPSPLSMKFRKSPNSGQKSVKKTLSEILPKPPRGKAKRKLIEEKCDEDSFEDTEKDKNGNCNTNTENMNRLESNIESTIESVASMTDSVLSTYNYSIDGSSITDSNKSGKKSRHTTKWKQNDQKNNDLSNDEITKSITSVVSPCLPDVSMVTSVPDCQEEEADSINEEPRECIEPTTVDENSTTSSSLRSKRTRRSAVGLMDFVQPLKPKRKVKTKQTPKKESKTENEDGEYKCKRCGSNYKALNHLKQHLMTSHNALWDKDCPEGLTDWRSLTTIIKKIGKLNCPQCGKEIRYMHYYKKHVQWCGREHEKFFCDLCQKYIMVMWEHEHNLMHIRKDKMEEMDRETETSLAEKEGSSEEVSTDKRRFAARRAEKLLMAISRSYDGQIVDVTSDDNDPDAKVEPESSEEEEYNDDDEEEIIGDFIDEDEKEEMRVAHDSKHLYTGIHFVNNFHKNLENCKQIDRYNNVQFPHFCPRVPDWNPLAEAESQGYLPCTEVSPEFCIKTQKQQGFIMDRAQLKMFESKCFKESSVFFVGGPVWGLAWCPMPQQTRNQSQYLAISCHLDMDLVHLVTDTKEEPNMIQIWNIGKLNQSLQSLPCPKLEFCIAHDYGVVRQMVWCPYRCWQSTNQTIEEDRIRQIGLLAIACGDGSIRIFSIPAPDQLTNNDGKTPYVYQPTPEVTLVGHKVRRGKLPGCITLSWSGVDGRYLLGGFGDGSVRIWDLQTTSSLLRIQTPDQGLLLLPFRTFIPHSKPVTCVTWCPHSSKYFMTTSLDRYMKIWSIDNLVLPLTSAKSSSLTTGDWPSNVQSVIYSDDDVYVPQKVHIRIQSYGDLMNRNRAINSPLQSFINGVWDLSVSNWHSMLLGCDFHGNLVATYYPAVHGEKKPPKSRMLLSKVRMIPKSTDRGESSTQRSPVHQTETYQETVNKYYLEFTQNMTLERRLLFDNDDQSLAQFPLKSMHRVEVNPNLQSCMFVASGGQAGLVQIHNINRCMAFHAARDLRQELRLGT